MQELNLTLELLNSVSFKDFFFGFLSGLSLMGTIFWANVLFVKNIYKERQNDLKAEVKSLKAEREAFRIELLKQQNMNDLANALK